MIRRELVFPDNRMLQRQEVAKLVQTAGRYESQLMVECGDKIVNAKSMLGLLSLNPAECKPMALVAEGPDAEAAMAAVLGLIAGRFQD